MNDIARTNDEVAWGPNAGHARREQLQLQQRQQQQQLQQVPMHQQQAGQSKHLARQTEVESDPDQLDLF